MLTNDMDAEPEEIADIYRQRWEIELLFKQIKQNFPLRYFGSSDIVRGKPYPNTKETR